MSLIVNYFPFPLTKQDVIRNYDTVVERLVRKQLLLEDESLESITTRLKETETRFVVEGRRIISTCIEMGEILLKAKKRVGHGKWINWVDDNCSFNIRTAQRYMRWAEDPDREYDSVSHLGDAKLDRMDEMAKVTSWLHVASNVDPEPEPNQKTTKQHKPKNARPQKHKQPPLPQHKQEFVRLLDELTTHTQRVAHFASNHCLPIVGMNTIVKIINTHKKELK